MKRLVLYVVLLTVTTSSYCQKTSFTRDDHLRKSKHAKTTAWILRCMAKETFSIRV